MANRIEYAKVFQEELDKQVTAQALSGWMENNAKQIKYNGGNEIKLSVVNMDGLADYDRNNGYTDGGIDLKWETHKLTMDRGRRFSIDAMDVDETSFACAAGNLIGEFQKNYVIPEIDAYRFSKIAKLAMAAGQSRSYTPNATDILKELIDDIDIICDEVGDDIPMVISINRKVQSILFESGNIDRLIDSADFLKCGISTRVKTIDGIPLIAVPSKRMMSEYNFLDGKSVGEEQGGFVPDASAKEINWIISLASAPIAVSKTDLPRIFDPMTNQKANSWLIDYRKYHDLWISENQLKGVFVNHQ